MHKYDQGSRPDLYSEFSVGRGYKEVQGSLIPTKAPKKIAGVQKVASFYWTMFLFAFEINQPAVLIVIFLVVFCFFAALRLWVDFGILMYKVLKWLCISNQPGQYLSREKIQKESTSTQKLPEKKTNN